MTPLKKEALAQETTLHRQRVQEAIEKAMYDTWNRDITKTWPVSLIRAIDAGEIPNLKIIY